MEAAEQTVAIESRAVRPANQAIREYLNAMFESGVVEGDRGQNRIFPASLTPERGRVLTEVCRAIRPKATLEVGMAWGVSTLLILEALIESGGPLGPHVVMDLAQSTFYQNAALRSLGTLGLEHLVEFYEQPSELVLPRLLSEGRRFDFAFIDGDHHFESVFTDFRFAHLLLAPGGTILFDDTWSDGAHLTVRYAQTNMGYKALEVPCEVPVYEGRPALRAIVKPLKPVCTGETDRVAPFFTDLIAGRGTVDDLLDQMIGEARATRIVMKGGFHELVEASERRVRETTREIAEMVRFAESHPSLGNPATAAEARRLLESVAAGFAAAHRERNAERLEEASRILERLREVFGAANRA